MTARRRSHQYFGLIVEAGALAALIWLPGTPPADWLGLGVFSLLCLGAEWTEVSLPGGILSTSFAVIYPAFILYGWRSTALAAALSLVIAGRFQRRKRGVVLFNAGQIVLSLLAGSALYSIAGGIHGPGAAVWENAVPLVLFPLGHFLANHLLVGIFFTLRSGQVDWAGMWLEPARWDLLNFLVAVPLGIVVVQLFGHQGLSGALLLFIPFFAVAYIFRISIRLSLANRELQALQGFSEAISASLALSDVAASIADALARLIDHDRSLLLLWDEAERALVSDGLDRPLPEGLADLRIRADGAVATLQAVSQLREKDSGK